MYKTIICMILWLAAITAVNADTLESEKDLKQLTDKIMEQVSKRNIKKAFDMMKPYVAISAAEMQSALQKSETQREQLAGRFGRPLGYEFIQEKKAGESIVRLTYLEKTEKHALIWMFYFYKGKKGWILNSFVWNEDMPLVFQLD